MSLRRISAAVLILICVTFGFAQDASEPKSFPDYAAMRARVGELFRQDKYADAARILEDHLAKFPDHVMANTYNLALMRSLLKDFDGAVKALLYGLEKGVWYGKYAFNAPLWAPLREHETFPLFESRNTRLMLAARKNVVPKLEVMVPGDFDKSKKYPLFIALHGGGENIEAFKPNWTSPVLKRDFIVAYPQSTQLIALDGYNWTEDLELSKKEIEQAYRKVVADYPVDTGTVLIGGFSSGGVASLETVLSDIFPVRGFVVLCPAKPEGFTAERVREAGGRGLNGTLLTTEMDQRIDQQKEMDEIMKREGLPCHFIVTPDIGHWYPKDMPVKLDEAIDRILKR